MLAPELAHFPHSADRGLPFGQNLEPERSVRRRDDLCQLIAVAHAVGRDEMEGRAFLRLGSGSLKPLQDRYAGCADERGIDEILETEAAAAVRMELDLVI